MRSNSQTPRPLTASDVIALLKDPKQGPALKAALFDALLPDILEMIQELKREGCDDDPGTTRTNPQAPRGEVWPQAPDAEADESPEEIPF